MASEGDADQAAMLRGILESVATGELARSGGSAESVAQLLAAAIAQVGQSILTAQGAPNGEPSTNETAGQVDIETANEEEANFSFNPQDSSSVQLQELESGELEDAGIVSTVEIPTSQKPKPICVKFPIELRKQIIAMRKEGKKCKDIAKELKISVSGAQKVWERFLATGTAHDRKPSSYAGRPRKYTYSQVYASLRTRPSREGLGNRLGRKCTVHLECRRTSDWFMIACLRPFIGNTNCNPLV